MNKPVSTPSWYKPLLQIKSKGSQAQRPGSLAGLHQARQVHEGQFFTSLEVSAFLWKIIAPVTERACKESGNKVSILDTSVGSGRLLAFADPAKHKLAVSDVDTEALAAFESAAIAAGFEVDAATAGMQSIRPRGHGVALINPPFSLHLDAPTLTPFSCTTWGSYGENSAATSHAYAVHQALDAAGVVLAVVPASYAQAVCDKPSPEMAGRLRGQLILPRGSFRSEGTEVQTSVLVFGPFEAKEHAPATIKIDSLTDAPGGLRLWCQDVGHSKPRPLDPMLEQASEPAFTEEVTGNDRVRLVKTGRKIGLRFACGLVHAKVINAIMRSKVKPMEGHRYPRGVKYAGQGMLDLEILLTQDDPMQAFEGLLKVVRDAGGMPDPDASLVGYLRKAAGRKVYENAPFGHIVKGGRSAQEGKIKAVVLRKRVLDPSRWGSPVLKAGQEVELEVQENGTYRVGVAGQEGFLQECELGEGFCVIRDAGAAHAWTAAFPPKAHGTAAMVSVRAHLAITGADRVASWDYQIEDLVEARLTRGAVLAWDMGCGKSRLALALCLAGGKYNAIVVEAHLIDEMVTQAKEAGLAEDQYQVLTTFDQCRSLRKINIVSYNRLRSTIGPAGSRWTMARYLRRRLATVVADEAHLLRNRHTAQTRALWMLSPKRRYAMTGTPAANQVQDLLPLAQWACGDGTARQPFGWHRPHVHKELLKTMTGCRRGMEVFMERHAVFEWVTREWEDHMTGGKRQVPKVNQVGLLRQWSAPLIKRRRTDEPMVSAHFQVPEAVCKTITVPWENEHLAHYLRTADLFSKWYADQCKAAGGDGRGLNLTMVLARVGAVLRACNFPQYQGKGNYGIAPHYGLTSKQEAVLDHLEELTEEGHKTICYTDGPGQADLLVGHLAKRGIEGVPFHGGIPIEKRTRSMNRRFREGDAPVLVANMAVTQTGLNLWQADREVFTCRSWSATQEAQAMARALRPQQTRTVEAHFFHLEGSIDEYQAQMVAMKADTAGASLDFLEPETFDTEFVHMDQILNRFIEDLAARKGLDPWRYREVLRAA